MAFSIGLFDIPSHTINKLTSSKPSSSPVVDAEKVKQVINPEKVREISDLSLGRTSEVTQPLVTGGSIGVGNLGTGVNWLLETLMREGPVAEMLGLMPGESMVRGPINAMLAWKAFQASKAISDKGGMQSAGTDLATRVNQTAGGACFAAHQFLQAFADMKHINAAYNAPIPLGKAVFWLGALGKAFFILLFVAMSLWAGLAINENAKFRRKLNACKNEFSALAELLKGKLVADPHSKFTKHTTTSEAILSYRKKCSDAAADVITELFCKQAEEDGLSQDGMREFVEVLFKNIAEDPQYDAFPKTILNSLGLTDQEIGTWETEANGGKLTLLEAIGFRLEEMKRSPRKITKFGRVAGSSAPKVQKALERGLLERLNSEDNSVKCAAETELTKLIGRVKVENTKNLVIFSALLGIGVLGLTALVISLSPGAPIGVGLIALFVLLCILMIGSDAYFMSEGLKGGQPGKYDKHYIAFIAFVMTPIIVGLSVGLTFGLGLPLIPLIFVGLSAFVGWGSCAIAWDQTNYKEQKWKWETPTLDWIYKMGKSLPKDNREAFDEKMRKMFKKLPKAEKEAVRSKYLEMSENLKFKEGSVDVNWDKVSEKSKLGESGASKFGKAYLDAYQEGDFSINSKQHKQLVRGVKETRNYYWEEWNKASTKQEREEALKAAIKMEGIYTQVKKYQEISALDEPMRERLEADLWYVTKREESKQDLITVVNAIKGVKRSFIDSALELKEAEAI